MMDVKGEESTISNQGVSKSYAEGQQPTMRARGRQQRQTRRDRREKPSDSFAALGISPPILRAIREMGFKKPTPIQAEAIPLALAGRDIIGLAQTGSGKTAAFGIPILELIQPGQGMPQALIITPTRELAIQVADELAALGKYKQVRLIAIFGGHDIEIQAAAIRHGVDIIVGTPGRLVDHMYNGSLEFPNVRHVVLDEADRMFDLGFIDDVRFILDSTPLERQTLLFSATMLPAVARIASEFLNDPAKVTIAQTAATTPDIQQQYVTVSEHERFDILMRILSEEDIEQAMIFCRTKRRVDDLVQQLAKRDVPAEGLHGDMSQPERIRVMNAFRKRKNRILIATDVAARGIDVDDVSHVINYDAPADLESYVHRIGRTGRAGRKGMAITFISLEQRRFLRSIEKKTGQAIEPRYPEEEPALQPPKTRKSSARRPGPGRAAKVRTKTKQRRNSSRRSATR